MKKMLVVLACLTAVILFAYSAGAQNTVFAGADSIHWRYENGKLIGSKTVAEINNVPKGIPASIAGQLVEGKITKYVRVGEKQTVISKVFSVSTLSRVSKSQTEIFYSKAGGWEEHNLAPAVAEQNDPVIFVFAIILPAVFIFLVTLSHFLNFGKIKLGKLLIFYIPVLLIIPIGDWIDALIGSSLAGTPGIAALVIAIIGMAVGVIASSYGVGGFKMASRGIGIGISGGLIAGAFLGMTAGEFIFPEIIWQYFLFFALVCFFSCIIVQVGAWLIGRIVLWRKTKTTTA